MPAALFHSMYRTGIPIRGFTERRRLYGPHVGPHEAGDEGHWKDAAITITVARIVGLPTSSTARMAVKGSILGSLKWRWKSSTTTVASSTRMPMEKIRAKRVTRFEGYP